MVSMALSSGLFPSKSNIDPYGHLGGLASGVAYTIAYTPKAIDS